MCAKKAREIELKVGEIAPKIPADCFATFVICADGPFKMKSERQPERFITARSTLHRQFGGSRARLRREQSGARQEGCETHCVL